MTIELKELINQQLDDAMSSGDQNLFNKAVCQYSKAMSDCQYKTASRVKDIAAEHPSLIENVKQTKEKVDQISTLILTSKAKAEGAAMIWKVLRYVATFGGGAGLPFLMQILS